MPNIGEIKRAREIGYLGRIKYIWTACPTCKKERWVHLVRNKPAFLFCVKCSRTPEYWAKVSQSKTGLLRGDKHPSWKGGRYTNRDGYVIVRLYPGDFFFPMAPQNHWQVPEHRLVVAKHLGRCLQSFEEVHHKNGIKNDNRIENLELTMKGSHILQHNKGYKDGYIRGYQDGLKLAKEKLDAKVNK